MRFTSLIVELVRARPRLVFWIVIAAQATLWLLLPLVLYGAPPGDLAATIERGSHYDVGRFGPPLAIWLADLGYRAAGESMIGVYLVAQICFVATFAALFALGRALVGASHAVLAVLLTMTVFVFAAPGVVVGPDVVARPVWALVLLYAWQVIGEGRRNAWFALSLGAGVLLLTTADAPWLLALLVAFALTTRRGRRALWAPEPAIAAVVVAALALPYLAYAARAGVAPPRWWHLPSLAELQGRAVTAGAAFGWLAAAFAGSAALALMNWRRLARDPREAPLIHRDGVDPLARRFVLTFALAPALLGAVIAGLTDRDGVAGGAGIALLLSGLALVLAAGDAIALRRLTMLRRAWVLVLMAPALVAAAAILLQPWIGVQDDGVAQPAGPMARFFADNFARRTGRPLPAVAGDPHLATLISLGRTRPRVSLPDAPEAAASLARSGGVVVWRARDSAVAPPADIAARFPGLVAEVPAAFDRLVNGRLAPLRVGWAIVRPAPP